MTRDIIVFGIDLSGSMTGQSISTLNVQLSEFLSELKKEQAASQHQIYLSVIGLHEKVKSIQHLQLINQIDHLPVLQVETRPDGMGALSEYSVFLIELNRWMKSDIFGDMNSVSGIHILFFTDGYPTDKEETLRKAMGALNQNVIFSSEKCHRYLIREKLEECKIKMGYRRDFIYDFVDSENNIVAVNDFSNVMRKICDTLKDQDETDVFANFR